MKVRIESSVLRDAVTWAARALPSRPPVPVLAGLHLTADNDTITLAAFDYETSGRTTVPAEVETPGRVLVSGRLLADIVRSLPAKPVDLTLDGTKVQLRCGPAKFTLLTMPETEYPSLPSMPAASGTVPADVFALAVGQVAVAASRDETLPILTGVRVEIDADTVTMLATDRYRLAMRTFPWHLTGDTATLATLVRSRTLSDVAKSLTAGSDLTIGVGNEHVGFRAGERETTSLLIDGEYPKVRSLFPAEAQAYAVVEVQPLMDAVRRVALVAERHTPVRCAFTAESVTLEAGQGEDAQASEALDASLTGGTGQVVASYNPQFLLDGLGALTHPYVRLSFTVPNKPAVITGQSEAEGDDDPSYRYLLMPVRLP